MQLKIRREQPRKKKSETIIKGIPHIHINFTRFRVGDRTSHQYNPGNTFISFRLSNETNLSGMASLTDPMSGRETIDEGNNRRGSVFFLLFYWGKILLITNIRIVTHARKYTKKNIDKKVNLYVYRYPPKKNNQKLWRSIPVCRKPLFIFLHHPSLRASSIRYGIPIRFRREQRVNPAPLKKASFNGNISSANIKKRIRKNIK